MSDDDKDKINVILNRLKDEIIPIFQKAIKNGNGVIYTNPHIVNCCKHLGCKTTRCILYGNESKGLRCWQVTGTYCDDELQGSLIEKYDTCSNCRVFKDSCPTIVEEIGEHINNLVFLYKKHDSKTRGDEEQIERLNKELMNALEQIDIKNREIQKMMITDKLTGLFNRHHLVNVLEDEIARCKRYGHPLAVMMIDIDSFKSINDNYGPALGDTMLAHVGMLINENTRKFDRSFRYGGEEFIVLLPETDMTLAYIVAERIRKSFESKSFNVTKKESSSEISISRTLSIGITAAFPYKTNHISIDDFLNQIDKALLLAKQKGGNICMRYEE